MLSHKGVHDTMKQRVSFFLIATILAGLLAACGAGSTGGGGGAAATAPAAAGGAPTTAPAAAAPTAAGGENPTAATGGGAAGGETIRIYSSLPRQGQSKTQTDVVVNAIKLRLDEDKNQACNGQ